MALLQPTAAVYHHPLDTTTESLQSDVWTAGVKPSGTVNLAAAKISNGMLPKAVYDAGIGTVPNAQGWALGESNSPAPASVSGGILTSTTTLNTQNQWWSRTDFGIGDLTADEFEIEFDLKIITSTIGLPDAFSWRTGWFMKVSDQNKRGFLFGVSGASVRLSNSLNLLLNANSTAFIATTTTDDFHKYRLSVSGGTGRLFKDGTQLGSIGVGTANDSTANRILFGDPSSFAKADIRLRTVTFPSAKLNGTGPSYPSVIGSAKLAYTGWLRNPSAQ